MKTNRILLTLIMTGIIAGIALFFMNKPAPIPQSSQTGPNELMIAAIENDAILGSRTAPVTIVEFSDYQCPFCARFAIETFPRIKKDYIDTGKVNFVYRDFPLDFHEFAQKASEASECANEQGKFWEYNKKLFDNNKALDVDSLKKYAKDLGLNQEQFNQCLDSGKMQQEVEKDYADGQKYGVTGTPAFIINGMTLTGAQPYDAFKRAIDAELKSLSTN